MIEGLPHLVQHGVDQGVAVGRQGGRGGAVAQRLFQLRQVGGQVGGAEDDDVAAQLVREPARRLAHELRGNVVIFGATDLAANLAQLEKALGDGAAPPALAAHCHALIDAVLDEMRQALDQQAALTRND